MVSVTPQGKTAPFLIPGWAPQGTIAAYIFSPVQQYWSQANPSGAITVSSPNTQYVIFADGHVQAIGPNNLPVSDLGLADWEASSNLITNTNDLTQSNWTKTNVTAALNAIGPDLLINSATTLTATANNGTVTQSITAASSNMQASVLIKRIIGSGAVSMTIDNGSTWAALTFSGANWAQVSIPQQTLANPTFGLKLATNGDVVAVWCSQVESSLLGSGPTAPMPDSANIRGALLVTLGIGAQLVSPPWTMLVKTNICQHVTADMARIQNIGKGSTGVGFQFRSTTLIGVGAGSPPSPFDPHATIGSGNLQTGLCKAVLAIDNNVGATIGGNSGTPGVLAVPLGYAVGPFTNLSLFPGGALDGYLQELFVWPYAFTTAQVQSYSTLP